MNLIEKYLPINTREKVDAIMAELRANPSFATENILRQFRLAIQKVKIQLYFNSQAEALIEQIKSGNLGTTPVLNEQEKPAEQIAEPKASESLAEKEVDNDETRPNRVYREIVLPSRSLDDRKYIYSTYIEMAFHNLFLTLHHIYSKVTGNDVIKYRDANPHINSKGEALPTDFAEKELWDKMFDEIQALKPEEKQKALELMHKHFPFLDPMLDKCNLEFDRDDDGKILSAKFSIDKAAMYIPTLKAISESLREVRNIYSHYKFKPGSKQVQRFCQNEKDIIIKLKKCFDGSRRIVKQRFSLTEKDMKCADRYIKDDSHLDAKGRQVPYENPKYAYKIDCGDKEEPHFTEFGILFFVSLLLEKKYAKIFSDKLGLTRKQDQSVICEMLSVYRIRLHVRKMSCEKDADAIALDILNELQKCPSELFEMLTPQDQKKFRVEARVANETEASEALMVRHSDRFAYLLMRYIDDMHLFKDIRFMVSLGTYFHTFYNKKCIDSTSDDRVRSLSKTLTGFGRISEIEKLRVEKWKDAIRGYEDVHKNTADESPYVTDHRANYVFNGNRIGLWIAEEGSNGVYMPELNGRETKNIPPTCWLSIYELPALAFYIHLKGAEAAENLIKRTVQKYRKLFSDISDGLLVPCDSQQTIELTLQNEYNGIRLENIPKNMQNYLCGRNIEVNKVFRSWAEEYIHNLIDESRRRIERFKENLSAVQSYKQNKIGKKQYVDIKSGKLADFLAKDIMLFQPLGEGGKNKLTSLNFRILQSVLATYTDGNFAELKRVFVSAHLINNSVKSLDNPIVTAVCRRTSTPANTLDFYKVYMEERLAYLKSCLRRPAEYGQLGFLYGNRNRWKEHNTDFYKTLAARYLHEESNDTEYDKALELPRGMFENPIKRELKTVSSELKSKCATGNVSYLIYAYFMKEQADDCQPFYLYKRNYRLFNTLYKNRPQDDKVYKTPKEIYELINNGKGGKRVNADIERVVGRLYKYDRRKFKTLDEAKAAEKQRICRQLKELKDTETILKRYKVQDMLLFMIAKKLLLDASAQEDKKMQKNAVENIRLSKITESDVLSQRIKFSVQLTTPSGIGKTITQSNLRLKDYNQFFRFLHDRRMPTLLSITREKDISRESLEKEFDTYDTVHPGVFKDVLAYEKAYYLQHENEEGFPDFSGMIDKDADFSESERSMLKKTRNSFAHVSYTTAVNKAKDTSLPEKARIIAETFMKSLEKKNK